MTTTRYYVNSRRNVDSEKSEFHLGLGCFRVYLSPRIYIISCRHIVTNKVTLWAASYSACEVDTKTIIHLSVGESGGYLPCRFTW